MAFGALWDQSSVQLFELREIRILADRVQRFEYDRHDFMTP